MQSSNPVLRRLGNTARFDRTATYGAGIQRGGYDPAGSGAAGYGIAGSGPAAAYPAPSALTPSGVARSMTLDDVVTRTVLLILVTGLFGAGAWLLLPAGPVMGLAMVGSMVAGLVLGLVIAFVRITNPVVISLYAAAQGVLLGLVSRVYESVYSGIVLQAVVGTFGVFLGMAVLYRFRVLRATPRFTRFVLGALLGVVALSLLNWVLYLFHVNMGLYSYDPGQRAGLVPILFALVCVAVGALTFILDFAAVEQGTRYGLPERYAWYSAFGLLVGLIFLYWQILRLLGYLRR